MPVVINEFEVVAAPPAKPAASATTSDESAAPPTLTPHEIARIVRQQMERLTRIWAH